jgi:hypothetical protein
MNQKYGLSLATALVSISMITIAVGLDPMPYSSNIIIISAAHATPLADVNVINISNQDKNNIGNNIKSWPNISPNVKTSFISMLHILI